MRKDKALDFEYCHGCGYPFDQGDPVVGYDDGMESDQHMVFCCKTCAHNSGYEI